MTNQNQPQNLKLGYLVLWRLPEVRISYANIKKLAEDVGFDLDYVPAEPKFKRNAWEKATNLGAKGLIVQAPDKLVSDVLTQHKARPTVKLVTKIISRKAPKLIRHIVREVTIPTTQASNKRKLAQRQLDSSTVAILEFDTDTNVMTSTSYSELHDEKGWVNGNLTQVVKDLENRVDVALNYTDSDQIRHNVREYLLTLGATLQSAGGAYFIPNQPGIEDKLVSLKAYLEGLTDAVVKTKVDAFGATVPADRPQFTIFPFNNDGSDQFVAETALNIQINAIEQFNGDLQGIVDKIAPVLDGQRTENVADRIRNQAMTEFLTVKERIAQYKAVLGDEMDKMEMILTMTQNAIKKSYEADYRPPAKRKKSGDK